MFTNSLSKKFLLPPFLFVFIASTATAYFAFGRIQQESYEDSPAFIDVIQDSGIASYPRSRGVAWADYNNDGYLDLIILGGPQRSRLYRNNGDGTFSNVTKEAGIKGRGIDVAAAFADYNNDGCLDFYVTAEATPQGGSLHRLYRNNCDDTFSDVTEEAGIRGAYNSFGIAWGDYNNDGYLDIYVANFGIYSDTEYVFEPNILWRNNGDGTFSNVTKEAGVVGYTNCNTSALYPPNLHLVNGPFKQSLQPIWFDYNDDGRSDLFIATDGLTVSPLYRNNGDGTFSDVTEEVGMCRIGTGMGVTAGDYDEDGDFDIYVTNTGLNYLWRNNGDGTFSEVAEMTGVGDKALVGWGTEFFDYDNNGLLDLYVTNGRLAARDFVLKLDRLYRNEGDGTFAQVAADEGILGNYPKEASAIADYNNDGFIDIFVIPPPHVQGETYRLYQNQGNENNWLTIQLVGKESNRDGIGAKITIHVGGKLQVREVRSGSSYISQSSIWQTFGLGSASLVDTIEVRWPSGNVTHLRNVPANQKIIITESK